MGGDIGLPVTIPASIEFVRQFPDVRLLLVGLPDAIEKALADARHVQRDRIEVVAAS
jgi:glycerol-3-phosphate acyltransferase PlsX